MGYMDLSVIGSDSAADFVFGKVIPELIKRLREGLKEEGNSYNTGGIENVSMFITEFILPAGDVWDNEDFVRFIDEELLPKLGDLIETSREADWGDKANKKWHLDEYCSWQIKLREFVSSSNSFPEF